jgi:phycocyanobilin:ferredoxin oxidoreductase
MAEMDITPVLTSAASAFQTRLWAEPAAQHLPIGFHCARPDGLVWENDLLTSATFRRGHVETFVMPGRVAVLHVCVFPHTDDPAPIFGFDMIAGSARVTGIFLDLSPVTSAPPRPGLTDAVAPLRLTDFAQPRTLPDWGSIFSPEMVAIRPIGQDETQHAITLGLRALDGMLRTARSLPRQDVTQGQARYILGQRCNEHTHRMLGGFIGAEPARRFIDDVLFPLPNGRPAAAAA